MSFAEEDFWKACDVFGDVILEGRDSHRAKQEIRQIEEIVKAKKLAKEGCQEVWDLIKGNTRTDEPRRRV